MVSASFSETACLQIAQELPVAARLLVELGRAIRNPLVNAGTVTALLRQDAALVARIIRMANSVAYGRTEPAGSIEEALAHIGFREVHRLVGSIAASQLAEQRLRLYGMEAGRLWENALFVAVLMENLAEVADEDPGSSYTVGLLRSIGKMAIERLTEGDRSLVPFAESGETELEAWEEKHVGMTNCEVAERILLHWRLPHETVSAIRHHYHPEKRHNPVIHLLSLAAGAAEHRCCGLPGEAAYWAFTPENFTRSGVDPRTFQGATERAQRTFQRLQAAMG